jgi:OOP family OmpA-OmpF porin
MLGKTLFAIGLGVSVISSVSAADVDIRTLRPYVQFGPQFVFADEDNRFADDGVGVFGGIGVPVNPYLGLEFNAFYDSLDGAKGGPDWDETGGEIGGLLTYPAGNGWVPYIGGSVGVVVSELSPGDKDTTDPMGSIGAGLFKYFKVGSTDLALRLDGRYRVVDLANKIGYDNPEEAVVRLALAIPFGEPVFYSEPEAAPEGDKDSDGDGVPDSKDQCPGTPVGVKVDAKGCPLDADGDGVADYLDKCPDTPKGVKVDKDGCAVAGESLVLNNVYFEFDSDRLTKQAVATLDKAVTGLQKNPQIRLVLAGHTDATGTDAYNLALSERRANSVKKYLTSKGIETSRLTVQAYGESRPDASNDTEE